MVKIEEQVSKKGKTTTDRKRDQKRKNKQASKAPVVKFSGAMKQPVKREPYPAPSPQKHKSLAAELESSDSDSDSGDSEKKRTVSKKSSAKKQETHKKSK